jgi:biotin synthase
MTRSETLGWLREQDERRLAELWERADAVRRDSVGDEVHLRGLIEFSNICIRKCTYCGLWAGNTRLSRYRMTREEIVACARLAVECGYGTVVLQSGDDPSMSGEWLAEVIGRVKNETPLAVTLSVGERGARDWLAWRQAGADRYLLRFETSDRELYDRVHPPLAGQASDRLAGLRRLGEMGYETGGGVMVGLPGQTYESLAQDVELFRELELDMIGIGPYIPHPAAPLGSGEQVVQAPPGQQAPNTELMTYKVLALARIACPRANIPSTTALATVAGGEGRQLGLERGANVVMPNLTPPEYRAKYEIYPNKALVEVATDEGDRLIKRSIRDLGRTVGSGPGASAVHTAAQRAQALSDYLARARRTQ